MPKKLTELTIDDLKFAIPMGKPKILRVRGHLPSKKIIRKAILKKGSSVFVNAYTFGGSIQEDIYWAHVPVQYYKLKENGEEE